MTLNSILELSFFYKLGWELSLEHRISTSMEKPCKLGSDIIWGPHSSHKRIPINTWGTKTELGEMLVPVLKEFLASYNQPEWEIANSNPVSAIYYSYSMSKSLQCPRNASDFLKFFLEKQMLFFGIPVSLILRGRRYVPKEGFFPTFSPV